MAFQLLPKYESSFIWKREEKKSFIEAKRVDSWQNTLHNRISRWRSTTKCQTRSDFNGFLRCWTIQIMEKPCGCSLKGLSRIFNPELKVLKLILHSRPFFRCFMASLSSDQSTSFVKNRTLLWVESGEEKICSLHSLELEMSVVWARNGVNGW